MAQDYKTIASQAVASLQQAEKQIADLKSQLAMTKKASTVDTELVQHTVQAMIKCGSIQESNKEQVTKMFTQDANTVLKAVGYLCEASTDAQNLVKNASQDLNYGTLVPGGASKASSVHGGLSDYAVVAQRLGLTMK